MILTNPANPMKPIEHFTITIAVGMNTAWVILATLLGIAVCFKKFNTSISGESIWAIVALALVFCISAFESYRTGYLPFCWVLPFFCFALFDRYNQLIKHESKMTDLLIVLNNYPYRYLNI